MDNQLIKIRLNKHIIKQANKLQLSSQIAMRRYGSCVLYKFKYLFKVASFFGAFPCKVKSGFDWQGKSPLFCRSSWLIFFMVLVSAKIIGAWRLIEIAEDDFDFYDYLHIFFKTSPSLLEKITFGVPLLGTYTLSLILALELGGYGKKLEYLTQESFSTMPKYHAEAKTWPLFKHVLM